MLPMTGVGASGDLVKLARTNPMHYTASGAVGSPVGAEEGPGGTSFEDAMLKAMDGVNAMQIDSANAEEAMLINPDSIDAHDVTIAMAKANMSLDITRTVLSRVVTAWKDIINTR